MSCEWGSWRGWHFVCVDLEPLIGRLHFSPAENYRRDLGMESVYHDDAGITSESFKFGSMWHFSPSHEFIDFINILISYEASGRDVVIFLLYFLQFTPCPSPTSLSRGDITRYKMGSKYRKLFVAVGHSYCGCILVSFEFFVDSFCRKRTSIKL